MYAVVSTGGKQVKVTEGAQVVVEKIDAPVGEAVDLEVLFAVDGESICTGAQALSSATVTAQVIEHFAGDKVVVFKFKKRKGYKRLKGHRQLQSRLLITDISIGAPASKPKAKAKVEKVSESPTEVVSVAVETASVDATTPAPCKAQKSSGEPCSNKAKDGSDFCGVHSKKASG
ncbi:MAG: 50S ribosomal protein L21 [Actinobacteria bacterium]|nr:50S ribosomal protein L21 [Actinomycetota bacterium]MCL5888286.1 50S ribosomal protein L21 [Actinomycetota bacterium]